MSKPATKPSGNSKTIVYVSRDIERALGKIPSETYRIITNRTPYAASIAELYPAWITLISTSQMLDTAELLEHEVTLETLSHLEADIVVFKNTVHIEDIVSKHSWNLLNPSAMMAEKIENKLTQIEWLGDLAKEFLPEHTIKPTKEIVWEKKPLIIQWAHGHTGDGTILINSAQELGEVQTKFPERTARVSSYIYGPSFTVNVVVASNSILTGNISYQITGIPPFTTRPFTTVGNDWSAPAGFLDENEFSEIKNIVEKVGEKMRHEGWKGLLGLDFMRDDERNRIVLIEINARQPASATFESLLQQKYRIEGVPGDTTFEAHLSALQGNSSESEALPGSTLIEINDGAQIIQRVTDKKKTISEKETASLEQAGYATILYPNTVENSDLLRIQSERGIMEAHNKFNSRGKEISDTLTA